MLKKAMAGNKLYPVFLKMDRLQLLVVGGGTVATEKLGFLLKSSPDANVTVIAKELSEEVKALVEQLNAKVSIKPFEEEDVNGFDLIIAATNDKTLNHQIWQAARLNRILINVADTPELCDFYLGGIVTKGDLKIAISTNGKSPTLAKRIREFLEDSLPGEMDELIQNLNAYRSTLKGNLEEKVKALNDITAQFKKK
jgi:precorrin-2 dehydrogenase/sirohydrochlorin ferrochelatase